MKNVLELKSSLSRLHLEGKEYEIFAECSAAYDHSSKIMTVVLKCFLQEDSLSPSRQILHPPWMPHEQTDHEHVDEDEATDLGREIFHRWCDSIKHSAPKPLH